MWMSGMLLCQIHFNLWFSLSLNLQGFNVRPRWAWSRNSKTCRPPMERYRHLECSWTLRRSPFHWRSSARRQLPDPISSILASRLQPNESMCCQKWTIQTLYQSAQSHCFLLNHLDPCGSFWSISTINYINDLDVTRLDLGPNNHRKGLAHEKERFCIDLLDSSSEFVFCQPQSFKPLKKSHKPYPK